MSFRRISIGRLFHSRGPAAVKLLSPICDCVRATVHVWTSDDLRYLEKPPRLPKLQKTFIFCGCSPPRWGSLLRSP